MAGLLSLAIALIPGALIIRIVHNLYFHPLAKFHGPWYAASFSLTSALACYLEMEPQWLSHLTKVYGTDKPIRIDPNLLLFSRAATLNDIYWDPKMNTKTGFYSTGAIGPPMLLSTIDGEEHKALRKSLGGPQWSIGALKNNWEPRIDDLLRLLITKFTEKATEKKSVILSDKVAEFAADVMTMVSFSEPWGFVKNGRDEKHILQSWRAGLPFIGVTARWRWFRDTLLKFSYVNYLLPKMDDSIGIGYLMSQADKQVKEREEKIEQIGFTQEKPDFLQHTVEAQLNGEPLSPVKKRAHVTLLIAAGADTTGTGLGSILRFILTRPDCLTKVRAEIEAAEKSRLLSNPIQYEETRQHLPYTVACIKEGHRVQPPVSSLFGRVVPAEGKKIDGFFIPGGTEVTTFAYVVHHDPEVFGTDTGVFRPERWLDGEHNPSEMDAAIFTFGIGPRVCLGRDIALMETYKVVPEIIRRFDTEVVSPGRHVVQGGIAYNQEFEVRLKTK